MSFSCEHLVGENIDVKYKKVLVKEVIINICEECYKQNFYFTYPFLKKLLSREVKKLIKEDDEIDRIKEKLKIREKIHSRKQNEYRKIAVEVEYLGRYTISIRQERINKLHNRKVAIESELKELRELERLEKSEKLNNNSVSE